MNPATKVGHMRLKAKQNFVRYKSVKSLTLSLSEVSKQHEITTEH